MYIAQRDKILSLLVSIEEALAFVVKSKNAALLVDCRDGIVSIIDYMESIGEPEGARRLRGLQTELEDVMIQDTLLKAAIVSLKKNLSQQMSLIKQKKCRYKAAFLPYKAEMWTSLESIWDAARQDPQCDATVVPIPFLYGRKEAGKLVRKYDEADRYPLNVPLASYHTYDLAKEEPELVFIHNPYDDTNTLTTVLPAHYSWELKNFTKCLVYAPYFIMGNYKAGTHDFQYVPSVMRHADKTIVQSAFVRDIYVNQYHINPKQLLVAGSPKIDAIVNANPSKVPSAWKEKIEGKKVFLLNTHLSYFSKAGSLVQKYGYNYAIRNHQKLLNVFLNRSDVALIWRPHPFLKMMTQDRAPESMVFIEHFTNQLQHASNCIVDELSDYRPAFQVSDAMISTYSSLIDEYLVTGKPVFIFQGKPSDQTCGQSPVDMRLCYFMVDGTQKLSFNQFVGMVLKNEDPLHDARMNMLKDRAFVNLDGTAGKHAYESLCLEIQK